jgi:hypothetical protein
VATLQYIASHTSVPVLAVYEWSADASSNQAGAEYMIDNAKGAAPWIGLNYPHPSGSIPGTPFFEKWGELPIHVKERGSSSGLFLQTVATFPSPSDPGFPAYLTSGNTALTRPGPRRLKRRMSFFRLYVLCLVSCQLVLMNLQLMHKL